VEPIVQFTAQYAFLSNFAPCEVMLDGVAYPSVEHAYQAAKTLEMPRRKAFTTGTSGQAKSLGRSLIIRKDWDSVRVSVMTDLLRQKFNTPRYKKMLLATGDAYLEEGNWWGDTFWGVDEKLGGKNTLGILLMKLRSELSSQEDAQP